MHGSLRVNKESNKHEVVDSISPKTKTKGWSTGTCFGIELYWWTRMLRNFNVKVRYFPRAKKNAIDHQSNDIIPKMFKLKEFIQLNVPSCKGYNFNINKKAWQWKSIECCRWCYTTVQQLNTETIINVNIEKNMLGRKGLDLYRNGLKQFAKNLIDAIRKLWKLEKPFCDSQWY